MTSETDDANDGAFVRYLMPQCEGSCCSGAVLAVLAVIVTALDMHVAVEISVDVVVDIVVDVPCPRNRKDYMQQGQGAGTWGRQSYRQIGE